MAWVAFTAGSSFVLLVSLLLSGRRSRLDARLNDLAGRPADAEPADVVTELALSALPKMGKPLVPSDEGDRSRLQARLIHAGLYGRQAMYVFLGVKLLFIISPPIIGLMAGIMGILP